MSCPIPYCPAIVADDDDDDATIAHLVADHGWPALLGLLRDGCIYDCDRCHME